MAFNDSLNNIGDQLIITMNPKAYGKISSLNYSDNLIGLSVNRNVKREYKITTEDVFTDDWKELTNENLSYFSEIIAFSFQIKVKYTRIGADSSGVITFVDFNISGIFESADNYTAAIKGSMFWTSYLSDSMSQIENNLFKKLYRQGIVAKYIKRGDNNNKKEDSGFFTLFSTIAKFFGLILRFTFRFKEFYSDYELLLENVKQKGIYINENNVIKEDLQYLSEHYYDEIRKRGTLMIFKKKGETLVDNTLNEFDGEFIRLLGIREHEEVLFSKMNLKNTNWCLGNNSPLYKGSKLNINKLKKYNYGYSSNVTVNQKYDNYYDLTLVQKYFDFNLMFLGGNLVIIENYLDFAFPMSDDYFDFLFAFENEPIDFNLLNYHGEVVFGGTNYSDDLTLLSVVSSNLSYDLSFFIKFQNQGIGDTYDNYIKMSIGGFDKDKNIILNSFSNNSKTEIKSVLIDQKVDNFLIDEWYNIKFTINSIDSNFNEANTFRFNDKNVSYILPKFMFKGNDVRFTLKDISITPSVLGRNHENSKNLCFLHSSNFNYIYFKNNNNNLSKEEVEKICEKYLLSYNSINFFEHL